MDIRLENVEVGDFPRLIGWANSPEFLMQWAGPKFRYPLTIEQLREHLEGTRREPPERCVLKAIEESNGAIVGHVELEGLDRDDASAVLARVLVAPEIRGRGFGRMIVGRGLDIAFGALDRNRVDLNVFEDNAAAIHLYERLGFQKLDVVLPLRRVSGAEWRVRRMEITRDDWLKRRAAAGSD